MIYIALKTSLKHFEAYLQSKGLSKYNDLTGECLTQDLLGVYPHFLIEKIKIKKCNTNRKSTLGEYGCYSNRNCWCNW